MNKLTDSSTIQPDKKTVPLAQLKPGQSGEIASVDPGQLFCQRLRDLGFVPGSTVSVRRRAPLRDPMEYEVRNSRICLRKSEASAVFVFLHVSSGAPALAAG